MGSGSALRRPGVLVVVALVALTAAAGLLAADHGPAVSEPQPITIPSRARSSSGPTAPVSGFPADDAGPQAWADAVAAENARPGSPAWKIPKSAGAAAGLDVFADRVSVLPGESVGLYISVARPAPVVLRALRVGWYGGAGARQVWQGRASAVTQPPGRVLTAPLADAGGVRDTRAVVAPWRPTTMLDTTGWPQGDYLLRVDAAGISRYTLLTVRSRSARGRMLVLAAPMTWQAYNTWGGRSLYGAGDRVFAHRSYAVSLDRPYSDGYGSGRFLTYDAPVVRLAERLGLPLAWATDYDLALHPELLDGAAAVVIPGHAEYWTGPMRDVVTAATARGTNLAVLGANTAYWRVRLAGRAVALAASPQRRDGTPRVIVGPKQASADPLAASDPGGATARFRDPPAPRREEALTGMRYDCFPAEADWVVADPTWWGYAGTGVTSGERLRGVVGPEADRVYPGPGRPESEQVVAYTRYSCGGHETAHTGVYWVTRGGGGVFAVGTMRWPAAMAGEASAVRSPRAIAVLDRVTRTVLTAFASPHAGLTHPAHDNVGRFWLPTVATSHAA
jgi:hypothetical protein